MNVLVQKVLENDLDPDFPQGSPSELFLHHYRTASEIDIQFGATLPKRKKVTDEQMISMFGTSEDKENGYMFQYSPNAYAFRVEFNPNNVSVRSISNLLHYFSTFQCALSSVRVARLDIAIDYDSSLDPYLVHFDSTRKSFYACGPSGLETVYFGSRASKNYVRLYNKRQEQIDKTGQDLGFDRWRFELESKESFFLDSVPDHGKVMQRFHFYNGGVSSGDWKFEFFRSFAQTHGLKAALSQLPPATRSRYRKLYDDFYENRSIESPASVYYRDFPLAMEKLRCDILSACGYALTA